MSPSVSSPYSLSRLPSGLRIVTESCQTAESVAIGIVIDGGSQDERESEQGLAHLCEHMVFQGTARRSAQQIARDIDATGGQIGAFTARDYTVYHCSALGDYAFHALELLGDLLLNPTFPADALEREKTAIICEIEGGSDDPQQRVQERLKQSIWPNHGVGHPICGSPEAVRGYSRDAAWQFFQQRYRPERTIIAAAGKLDHEDFVTQVKDIFWHWSNGDSSAPPLVRSQVQYQPTLILEPASTKQAYFCVAFSAPTYTAQERYLVHVLNKVMGAGISSRLFRRLREASGLVYDIHSSYLAYQDAGLITVEGSTSPESVRHVIPIVLQELYRLGNGCEPVSEEELVLAKRQIAAEHSISGESIHTRMCRLATQELYFQRPIPAVEVQEAIESVGIRQVRSFASSWLAAAVAEGSIGLVGPPELTVGDGAAEISEWLTSIWSEHALKPKRRRRPTAEHLIAV